MSLFFMRDPDEDVIKSSVKGVKRSGENTEQEKYCLREMPIPNHFRLTGKLFARLNKD